MFRSAIELVLMEKWPLMDGFLHLEDQWPGWIDGLMEGWSIEVFSMFWMLLWCLEVNWGEIGWKLIEKGKSHKIRNSVNCVCPVDRTLSRSTGHTKMLENTSLSYFLKQCTDSVPGRPDPVSVDRAHRKTQEIAKTWSFRKEQKCSVPGRHQGRIH